MQDIPESLYLCSEFNYRRYADVTNLKLVIQASDLQGNGITRAYSKAAPFKYCPPTLYYLDNKGAKIIHAVGYESREK